MIQRAQQGKRLLVITAHPDDESFGPAGTIALYAKRGVEVMVVCATRGEAGLQVKSKKNELGSIREQELLNAAKVMGVEHVEFLDFIDGTLNNQQYHLVAEKIIDVFNRFKPQVVVTYEPRGVSGHLDHVAMSFITTYAYFKSTIPQKLYYYGLTQQFTEDARKYLKEYFVYFPDGYKEADITTRIDVSSVWKTRIEAARQHHTQQHDVERVLAILEIRTLKVEHYIRHHCRVPTASPETDLFAGI